MKLHSTYFTFPIFLLGMKWKHEISETPRNFTRGVHEPDQPTQIAHIVLDLRSILMPGNKTAELGNWLSKRCLIKF